MYDLHCITVIALHNARQWYDLHCITVIALHNARLWYGSHCITMRALHNAILWLTLYHCESTSQCQACMRTAHGWLRHFGHGQPLATLNMHPHARLNHGVSTCSDPIKSITITELSVYKCLQVHWARGSNIKHYVRKHNDGNGSVA